MFLHSRVTHAFALRGNSQAAAKFTHCDNLDTLKIRKKLGKVILNVIEKMLKGEKLTKAETSKSIDARATEMFSTLEQATNVEIPAVANADAKRYIAEAIDTHKKWALTQQIKIGALVKADLDTTKKMSDQADQLAMQEALALSLAFKAVGLPIE